MTKTESELLALIAKLEILARAYHRGFAPSQNWDDITRREKVLADARAALARLPAPTPPATPLEALRACKAAVENKELPPSARMELVRDIATPILCRA